QPDGRELLTCTREGPLRWPIQEKGKNANEVRLGPPRALALPVVCSLAAAPRRDGRTLAAVSEAAGTGLLVDLATDTVKAPRFTPARAVYVALSGDGRWMATGGWHSDRARLWNARTGQMVREWIVGRAAVFFTPDSRVLIISQGDEFSFHDVATLQPVR